MSEYMTTVEAAKELKRSRARVDQFCREGRLSFVMVGNARLILRSSVAAFKKIDRPAHRPKRKK